MRDDNIQPVNTTDYADNERRRALSIFRYLHDLALLRTAVVRDLKSYERVFWLEAARKTTGCTVRCFRPDSNDDGQVSDELLEDDVWLKVRKRIEPTIPQIPTVLEPLVSTHLFTPPRKRP